jgi:hypothetical protein
MKKIILAFTFLNSFIFLNAQMDIPPAGGNPKALVSETVGITSITIIYSRPDVNKREGKIFGDGSSFLVPYGFSGPSFITGKNIPWRAGANENTTITFEHDVMVEGKPLKAGTYGLHMSLAADNATLIFSNQSEAWGSFSYDEKYDALRVNVKPVALDKSVEWLKYEFIEHKEKSCVVALQWEKLSVPFKIEVDVDNIVLTRLREQITSQKQFNSTNMIQASQWCFNKNINLEEALGWAQRAVTGFQGQRSYVSLRNLAVGYEKLNRLPQADSVMNDALTMANVNQYAAYARALITQKRNDKAMEIMNAAKTKFGDVFAVNNGLSFAYSAKGDYKKAKEHAEKALAQAPEPQKAAITANIAKLKEGKDINQ